MAVEPVAEYRPEQMPLVLLAAAAIQRPEQVAAVLPRGTILARLIKGLVVVEALLPEGRP